MKTHIAAALDEIKTLIGSENVISDSDTLAQLSKNSLGVPKKIAGCIYPCSPNDVQNIIRIANTYQTPLYPVSRGENIGYGDKSPVKDYQILVSLEKMNRILEFDDIHGYVTIEPGVSQKQLYDFLQEKKANFWMDATAAGNTASIVGNTLEGGFGHTPKGDHRNLISNLTIVLGNGQIINTGTFPGLGPDISGLFVQSNFGIVIAMQIELVPIPEHYESFVLSLKTDKDLERLITDISELRRQGVLNSLLHITNATRALISTKKCPEQFRNQTISNEMAQQLMTSLLVKIGLWSGLGALYGSKQEIIAKKKLLKKRLSSYARIRFFTDKKIRRITRFLSYHFFDRFNGIQNIREGLESYRIAHDLMKGIPSDEPKENIYWRIHSKNDLGLIWFAPTFSANGEITRKVVSISESLFNSYGFELPITFTLVKPDRIVGILSISFNINNKGETKKAHDLYHELKQNFERHAIQTYRSSILNMDATVYHDQGKIKTLKQLKSTLDPCHIISPGRYGI